jgi:UDP-2,3-diacylglucosamine pyrophosphatase LpxH
MSQPPVKIVISDTHLGAGFTDAGNNLEDFTSDVEFSGFVRGLAAESDRKNLPMDFIINGDFIEFLQVPALESFNPQAVYPPESYAAATEHDALRKLELVIQGHRQVFDALGAFVSESPTRRVLILWGNHDPELFWPGVQNRIRLALGAEGEKRSLVMFPGQKIIEDGVYVEHGNQYTESYNQFSNPSRPVDSRYPTRVEHPAGSRFVIDFFNDVERERYWVDGVKPTEALAWYALAYDTEFALEVIPALIKASPVLLGVPVPLAAETATTAALLSASLSQEKTRGEIARSLEADRGYRQRFFVQVRKALKEAGYSDPWADRPISAAALNPAEGGDRLVERERDSLVDAAERIVDETGARVVVFGHTHQPLQALLKDNRVYLNSGTWVWRGDFSAAGPSTWADLFHHPEKYASQRDLSYVRVDYNENGEPCARLLRVGSSQRRRETRGKGCLTVPLSLLRALLRKGTS